MTDLHPTVTQLRAFLATEPSDALDPSTLPGYTKKSGVSVFLIDTTHAYWQIDNRYYSLMLPEWARKVMEDEDARRSISR